MAGIFINYRRDDAPGVAGRLFDYLTQRFPHNSLFMDVDAMKPGVDFAKQLDSQVSQCRVLLAVIGPHWLDAKDKAGQRRLEAEKDYVRIELASALKRDIPVIPVLVDGAMMPTEEGLPEDLRSLAYRHALELRHTRFNSDADAIVHALEQVVPRRSVPWLPIGAAALVALGLVVGGTVWWKKKHAIAPQPAIVAVTPQATMPPATMAPAQPAVPSKPAPAAAPAPAPASSLPAALGAPLPTGQSIATALGAATPANLPAGTKFGEILTNIAFRGSVMSYQKINPDPLACQAICRANAQCAAWTYTRPRDPDPQGGCSQKAVLLPVSPDPCCTSAIERSPPPELLQPPTVPAGMTGVIAGAELDGGTYRYFGDATPESCQSACRADGQCMAWDYVRPGVFSNDARCFLKNKPSMQVSSPCCIAGFEQHAAASPTATPASPVVAPAPGLPPGLKIGQLMTGVSLPGSNYDTIDSQDPPSCKASCLADRHCVSWTYLAPVGGQGGRCAMKALVPSAVSDPCCTSEVERPQPEQFAEPPPMPASLTGALRGIDMFSRAGNYRVINGAQATAEACQSACNADGLCQSWTYVRPGVVSGDNRCVLRAVAPPKTVSNCCISGLKQPAAK